MRSIGEWLRNDVGIGDRPRLGRTSGGALLTVRGLVYFQLLRSSLLHATLHGWGVVGVDVVGRFRCGKTLDAARIDRVAQLLRGLEERDALGGHIDALAGLGVAADAGVALARAEAAEPSDFDFVAGFERSYDGLKEGIDDDFAVASG